MKTFKLMTIMAGILALAALASCTEKVEDPFIKIEGQKDFNLTEAQQTVSVQVLSNRDWGVRMGEKASDWIVVEPSSGKASAKAVDVTITVLANTGTNRETAIEFYTGTATDMISVKQAGPGGDATPKPSGEGTLESPYNVAAALQTASGLSWTSNDNCEKAGPYYVKGIISRIGKDKSTGADLTYAQSGSFSNATFYISDDGSTNDEFYCYRLYYLGNKKFAAGNTDIKVGDEVVIYAELMNYSNNTPENSGGYLYSLNGETGGNTPDVPAGNPEGDGSEASPYNVAAALQATANLSWTSNDNYQKVGPYYVKGKISQIGKDKDSGADLTYTQSGTFSNATFYISDDGSTSNEFYCYRVKYLGNETFVAGQTDIKVGDEVVIYSELMNYRGNTPETSTGGYLYSLNGQKPVEVEYEEATVAQILTKGVGFYTIQNATVECVPSVNTLIINDGTGLFYVYKKGHGFAEGDALTLKGHVILYEDKVIEMESPEITKTGTATVTRPTPEVMDGAGVDAYFNADMITVKYVTTAGVIVKTESNGKTYYNLQPTGASVCEIVSLYYGERDMTSYNGKPVKVTGYVFTATAETKNISQALISIEEDTGSDFLSVLPSELTWAADETTAKTVEVNTSYEGEIVVTADEAAFGGEVWATATVSGSTITITPNSVNESEDAARSGAFTVTCGEMIKTITVSQAKVSNIPSFDSNVNWTGGKNFYDQSTSTAQSATINGISVTKIAKLGKSGEGGDFTIDIPSGTKKVGFYAVAWKGKSPKLTLSGAANATITPKSNDGASNNAPYIITIAEEEAYYEVDITDSSVGLKIESSNERVILWGINAYN